MTLKRNTQTIVRVAAEKSRKAGRRVMEALIEMQREGAAINFNTIGTAARVSKTFLNHPKHSDLAQQIRSLSQLAPQSTATKLTRTIKSDSAKDAQIARFKRPKRYVQVSALPDREFRHPLAPSATGAMMPLAVQPT